MVREVAAKHGYHKSNSWQQQSPEYRHDPRIRHAKHHEQWDSTRKTDKLRAGDHQFHKTHAKHSDEFPMHLLKREVKQYDPEFQLAVCLLLQRMQLAAQPVHWTTGTPVQQL